MFRVAEHLGQISHVLGKPLHRESINRILSLDLEDVLDQIGHGSGLPAFITRRRRRLPRPASSTPSLIKLLYRKLNSTSRGGGRHFSNVGKRLCRRGRGLAHCSPWYV